MATNRATKSGFAAEAQRKVSVLKKCVMLLDLREAEERSFKIDAKQFDTTENL